MQRTYVRRYPRIGANFPAEYTLLETTVRTRVSSLGGGGLFLGVSRQVELDTELTVRFRPAKHLPLIEARACVRHQIPDRGIGIEFTEISPEHRQQILRLICHRMGERRKYPRAPFAVQVEHASLTFIGFSKDIGVGGMFIETKEPVAEGSSLKLRFHLGDGGPIVVATAEVLYAVGKIGIGVHFIDLSPGDGSRIEAYVSK